MTFNVTRDGYQPVQLVALVLTFIAGAGALAGAATTGTLGGHVLWPLALMGAASFISFFDEQAYQMALRANYANQQLKELFEKMKEAKMRMDDEGRLPGGQNGGMPGPRTTPSGLIVPG